MEQVDKFISFMGSKDCAPARAADIVPDDTWRDYQIDKDPSGKKKGYYILTIEGEYVHGACGDRRTGETHQYRGQPIKKLTDEQRRRYAADMEERRKRQEADKLVRQQAVAEEAAEQWNNAKAKGHIYLKNKNISAEFSRVDSSGDLLIPMYYDKKIWNIQSIDKDGNKLFKKNGLKKGSYCPLARPEDGKEILLICEGFATGKSIREATGRMVLVAFDAGNLVEVARDKAEEYPESLIVICADNDASKEKNVGLEKGMEAAEVSNGVCIYPEFKGGDVGTDFNDYEKLYGIEALRECIGTPEKPAQGAEWLEELPPIEAYNQDAAEMVSLYSADEVPSEEEDEDPEGWKALLNKDSKGNLKPKSLNNVSLILEKSPKFKDMFCYDEFAQEKKLVQCPPWEDAKKFKPRAQSDEDVTWLTCELEKHGITLGFQGVQKILDAVIMKKRRNPAKEYFSRLEWDGVERLDTWLEYYTGAVYDDKEYLSKVGKKFMTACVSRVMNAGCKFDHTLILEGNQGIGKSTLLKTLATIHGKAYFTDSVQANELGTDKGIYKTQGVLIVELAELTELDKTNMDKFKQQITIQEDRIVLKYRNEATDLPRQYVLVGTINPKSGYLDDPTGLRRFWPVKTGDNFKIEELKKDREQLFAEAVHLYREGYPLYMDKKMSEKLAIIQESRKLIAPWTPDLEYLTENRDFLVQREIWEQLGIKTANRNPRDLAAIAKIMTSLGWEQGRKTMHGKKLTGWKRKVA